MSNSSVSYQQQDQLGIIRVNNPPVNALSQPVRAGLMEALAAAKSDIDVVYLNGYGFPAWRGGPMFYADTLGLGNVIDKLNALKALTGDTCWEPNSLLLDLAEKGKDLNSLNERSPLSQRRQP